MTPDSPGEARAGLPRRGDSGAWAISILFALGLGLSGCGAISEKVGNAMADSSLIGLPPGTPARPATQPAFPAVHDMPATRPAALTGNEQIVMEDELVAARNRQQSIVGQPASPPPASYAGPPPAAKKPAAQTAAKKPSAPAPAAAASPSNHSIY